MIRMHSVNETEFSMGEWASSRAGGIRNFRYSRNMVSLISCFMPCWILTFPLSRKTVNPSTYKTLDKPGYWGVHVRFGQEFY